MEKDYLAAVDAAYDSSRPEELESRLTAVLDECRSDLGETSREYIAVLSELAAYYRGQMNLEKSRELFRRAVALGRDVFGEDSPDFATLRVNLSGTLRLTKEFDEAERELLEAISIYDQTLPPAHALTLAAWNNLSLIQMDQGLTGDALQIQERLLHTLEDAPDLREELATTLINIGSLQLQEKNYEEAKRALRDAIRIYDEELSRDTPHYFSAWNALGIAEISSGDPEAAVNSFRRALDSAESLFGPDHPQTASIRNSLEFAENIRRKTGGTEEDTHERS